MELLPQLPGQTRQEPDHRPVLGTLGPGPKLGTGPQVRIALSACNSKSFDLAI